MPQARKTKDPGSPKPSEAVCLEITVSASADGKVAINDYGKRTSGWGVFMSKKFGVPEHWTEDQIEEFQKDQHAKLYALVDEIDVREHNIRWDQREWS